MISIFIPVDVFLDFVHLHLQKKRQTNKNKRKTTNKQNNLTKTNQTKNNKSKNQEDIVSMLNEMHVSYHKKVLNDKSWLFVSWYFLGVYQNSLYSRILLCHAEYEFQVKINL